MRAGQLNRQISIRKPSTWTRSTDGEPIMTYTTLLTAIWADRQPVSGRELFAQDSRWSEVTVRFVTRYSSSVDATCQIVDLSDSSAVYDIKAVIDMNDQRRGLELLASRVV